MIKHFCDSCGGVLPCPNDRCYAYYDGKTLAELCEPCHTLFMGERSALLSEVNNITKKFLGRWKTTDG